MNKTIFFFIIGLISLILTFFQFRYLESSFFAEKDRVVSSLKIFRLIPMLESSVLNKNIFYQNEPLKNSDYTLSFFIQTRTENSPLVSSSSGPGGGSIYWNINLVDGKLETGRVDAIAPVLVNQKINDNQWHHIIIQTGQVQSIYIDNQLVSRMSTRFNTLKDRWFNFTLEPNSNNPEPIKLRNIVFLNKSASIGEIENFYKKGDFLTDFLLSFVTTFLTIALLLTFSIWYIKKKYPLERVQTITKNLSYGSLIFIPGVLSMWSNYMNKALFLTIILFLYYLTGFYKRVLPESLYLFINSPLSFFLTSARLVYSRNLRKLCRHLFAQYPSVYFLILIFLGFLAIL
ncbi:MAG: hypothetical protein Q8Q24_01175 [bacterium]|nr:hypothetical protein [bacterium]